MAGASPGPTDRRFLGDVGAEKGHYLLPYARLLLGVVALRDGDRNQAREILADLAREFPNNKLYVRELARLQ